MLVRTSCTAGEHHFHQRYLLFIGLWGYGVLRTIDLSHASFADLLKNLVMRDCLAEHKPSLTVHCSWRQCYDVRGLKAINKSSRSSLLRSYDQRRSMLVDFFPLTSLFNHYPCTQ